MPRFMSPQFDSSRSIIDLEVDMADLAEILRSALSLNVDERALLANRLLASLDELDGGSGTSLGGGGTPAPR